MSKKKGGNTFMQQVRKSWNSLISHRKRTFSLVTVIIILFGSLGLPPGNQSKIHAAAATDQDIAFEQANYGTLVAQGYVENPALGSKTVSASKSYGYEGGTYYRYAKSITTEFSIPTPNTTRDSKYFVVIEPTTSSYGNPSNGVTSYNRQISVSGNNGGSYSHIWSAPNNGYAIGASAYYLSTDYTVVQINGIHNYNQNDTKGQQLSFANDNDANMTNMKILWEWDNNYYETMKSLRYRVYRTDIAPTPAPPIIVSPTESYHTGNGNSFVLSTPPWYAHSKEQSDGVLQYRLNDGNWVDYNRNPVSVPNEGETKIESRLLTYGTIESVHGFAYSRQDNTPPDKPSFVGIDPNAWYKSIDLNIQPGQDRQSGIAGVNYSMYGATERDKSRYTPTVPITNEGQTIVTATTVDNVGIESDLASTKINIDRTTPVAIVTAPLGYSISVTIQADGLDAHSGMKSITLPDGSVQTGSHADYKVTKNGDYTFVFTDKAGNSGSKMITVSNIDDVKPSVHVDKSDANWINQPVSVSYEFKDAESGLNGNKLYYKWSKSQSVPDSWDQSSAKQTIMQDKEGIWYLHLQGYDLADNKTDAVFGPYRIQQIPQQPNLWVIGTATDRILLSWSLPSGDAETDGLHYAITNTSTGKSWDVQHPDNQTLDTGLTGSTNYNYTITAINHIGSSVTSAAVTGVTLPNEPVSAKIHAISGDYKKVYVDIDPVATATGYRVIATNRSTNQVDADVTVTGNTYQEVSGLRPYTMYDFGFKAVNESGEGSAYHTSFLSLPDRLDGFTSAQITKDMINLTWNMAVRSSYDWSSVTDDTYYQLRRDNQLIFEGMLADYQDTGLRSGTSYDYDVIAGNSTGWGNRAFLHGIWTLPAAPESVTQTSASATSFTIKYDVPRGTTGIRATIDDKEQLSILPMGQYTFTGYDPGTIHKIELTPYNSSGYGDAITGFGMTRPDIPTDGAISIENIEENSVTFDVYAVKGATKYQLEINHKNYNVGPGSFTVFDLEGGTTYNYSFAGGNDGGFGESYNNHVLTLPSQPTDYEAVKHSPNALTFKWSPVKSADRYEIYDGNVSLLTTVTNADYRASGLTAGQVVNFHVKAINSTGESKLSTYKWRTIPGFNDDENIDYDNLVVLDQVGINDVQLHYPAVPGADFYRIYDEHGQLIQEVQGLSSTILNLQSAMKYAGYKVVPVNTTGEGTSMTIPNFTTKPSNKMELSYDSTRSDATLHFKHSLSNETLVITSQDQELYRGTIKYFTEYKQDRLQAGSTYTFTIWTENSRGEKSDEEIFKVQTKTDRIIVDGGGPGAGGVVKPNDPIEEESDPTVTPEQDTSSNQKSFKDIDASFAKESINRLAAQGIVQGISDDLYAPQEGTTRAEFMAMLTRLTLTKDQIKASESKTLTFEDTDDNAWYMPELHAAIDHGIAKGYSDTTFAPSQPIDREQAAKMLSGALYSLVSETDGTFYEDKNEISEWALAEVNGLTITEVVKGYPDQTFKPHRHLTRAESAAMVDRAMEEGMIGESVN